jgi:predicted ATP-dependent endonuclease of OLD family
MRVTEVTIKNYRSFGPTGQTIVFPTAHCALIGKNNVGKSNILSAIELVLGAKNPTYVALEERDYFDPGQPIEIKIVISEITEHDKTLLFSLPGLPVRQRGALNGAVARGTANVTFLLKRNLEGESSLDIKLWGFNRYNKKEDIRRPLIRMLLVPAVRSAKDELTASGWTPYGQLMKEILERSSQYGDIKTDLSNITSKIQQAFANEKTRLLESARIMTYVEDVDFQLTRDGNPSELLRNLEIFVKEGTKTFNISDVGTGTQSAIIIGVLELVLRGKSTKLKLFGIEEPENFIHPHGIRYLGALIRSISNEQNTQLLISTHSLSLTANFEPKEIILVSKESGETVIRQDSTLSSTHYRRFVHQDNVEMFFSDRVVFTEGETEKHLFCNLDKAIKQDVTNQDSDNCNFDRKNVGVIRLESANNIVNFVKLVKAFGIPFSAILDKDFLTFPTCSLLCTELGVTHQTTNPAQLLSDLKSVGILINTKGEIEDLFPDTDIANASGRSISDIQRIKAAHTKTSSAFKEIFSSGKAEYAIKLADYYVSSGSASPVDDIIRNLYSGNIPGIVF